MSKVCHNSLIFVKWSFRVREENKSISWLIGAVLLKIWQCLEIGKWSVIRLKAISMVRIDWRPNRYSKLSNSFQISLFHTNIIKEIHFLRFDEFLRKFLKLVKNALSRRDKKISEMMSEVVVAKVSYVCRMFAITREWLQNYLFR